MNSLLEELEDKKFKAIKAIKIEDTTVGKEINKLGKLSIFVARKPNQKKMIELITEKFLLGKKIG